MTLIILLIVLGIEYCCNMLDKPRQWHWFSHYAVYLQGKLNHLRYWDGALGFLLMLAPLLCLLLLTDYLLQQLFFPLSYLFSLFILCITLAPPPLNRTLTAYVEALKNGNNKQSGHYVSLLCGTDKEPKKQQEIIHCIFINAQQFYTIIFWFIILGPFGAILYRCSRILQEEQQLPQNLRDIFMHLNHILDWPATRLFVLGNALAGNMLEALSAWWKNEHNHLHSSRELLLSVSLGALNYHQGKQGTDKIYWIKATQELLNRTLIIWLIVFALLTIIGTLV